MKKQIRKKLVVLATTFTIIMGSIMPLSEQVFAGEEYRLELFNQLAEKVTSLYYKEAVVGLVISDEIYNDPNLIKNIEKHLEKDQSTKSYLLERGFDQTKREEIVDFIGQVLPNVADMSNEENKNIIKRLISTALIEENGTLSFTDYDEDIKQFGKSMYDVLPKGAQDIFEEHFKTEEEKIDAMIKIVIEFIYNGHGKVKYDEKTNEYVDLELMVTDLFIGNVNDTLGVELLNENSKNAINIFLSGLQDTIESNELTKIYTDLALVLNMVGTHPMAKVADNAPKEASIKGIEESEITRGEIVKILLDSMGLEPIEYKGEFTDVMIEDIYSGHISKAKNIGIINGYIDNTFKPMTQITTLEAMSIINRAIEYLYGMDKLTVEQIDNALKDIEHKDKIENWARESVANLVILEIIESDYSGEFGSDVFITRDAASKMINKIKK